jgi:hypothetical protein
LLIVGTFEYSVELEQALAVLEHMGFPQKSILVVAMDSDPDVDNQYIGKSRDRYYKAFEIGMAGAAASSVIGMSIGLVLKFGPVFWGLLFGLFTFWIGFAVYLLINKDNSRHLPKKLPEVIVLVQTAKEKSELVMGTFWKYRALTVGSVAGHEM